MGSNLVNQYKSYCAYIREYLVQFTEEELEFFNSLNIDTSKSYLVLSRDFEQLRKFANSYLVRSDEASFITYDVNEYLNMYASGEGKLVYSDVLIIHYPQHAFDFSIKQKEVISNMLLQTVTSRNRIGFSTLVISEKPLEYLATCGELITVSLSNTNTGMNSNVVSKSWL